MPYIDPSVADQRGGSFEPGVYLAEVSECELKRSKKGDEYFSVKLTANGESLAYDALMLEGKGAIFGIPKLRALGFFKDGKPEDVQAVQLIGRRVWVRVDWQTYDGKRNLKPISVFEPAFDAGYYPEDSPPEDATSAMFPYDESASSSDPSKVPF